MFREMVGNHLEVVLADRDETIYFTATHVADLKAVIKAEAKEVGDDDTDGPAIDAGASEVT